MELLFPKFKQYQSWKGSSALLVKIPVYGFDPEVITEHVHSDMNFLEIKKLEHNRWLFAQLR